MKLEVGKTYRMRNGDTVTIKAFDEKAERPYAGVVRGFWKTWTRNGRFRANCDSDADIISEVIPPRIMWMNEYPNEVMVHPDKQRAEREATSGALRTAVRVQIIEMPEGEE